MHPNINIYDSKVFFAVLFIVSVLAITLIFTVKIRFKEPPIFYRPHKAKYHTEGFDFKSFKDVKFIVLLLLPFAILYLVTKIF